MTEPLTKNTGIAIPTDFSGLAVHVLDRSANSHRKTGLPRPTTYETNTVASQKQLESTCTGEKIIKTPMSLHPHLQWWLEEGNVLTGQPLHPIKHALQIFTYTSKEGWGPHLNGNTARGTWSFQESKVHICN